MSRTHTGGSGCGTGSRRARSEASEAGQQAYREGVVVGDNPRDENSDGFWQWMAGWAEAALAERRGVTAHR